MNYKFDLHRQCVSEKSSFHIIDRAVSFVKIYINMSSMSLNISVVVSFIFLCQDEIYIFLLSESNCQISYIILVLMEMSQGIKNMISRHSSKD